MEEKKTGAPSPPAAAVPDQSAGSVSESDTGSAKRARRRKKKQEAQEVNTIVVNTNVDPELNPNDPQFNPQKYREYLSSLDLTEVRQRLNSAVKTVAAASAAAAHQIEETGIVRKVLPEMVMTSLQEILQIGQWANEAAQAAQAAIMPQIKTLFDEATAEQLARFIESLQGVEAKAAALEPFLEKELPAIREQPGFEDITLEDLKSYISMEGESIPDDTDGDPIPAVIRAALERAIAAAKRAELPKATAKRAEIVDYPIDKINSNIWNLLQETTGRQLKMRLDMSKEGSKEIIPAYYSIDFEELENTGVKVTKKLLPFDKRVYIAVAALCNAGNKVMTLTQIHYAMGNTGRPSGNQLEKINESITKMRGANVFIDTLEESQKYNYPRFKYEDYLLPVARATAIVNGQLADAAIQLSKEPPLITFAKQRKQLTVITVKVLQVPQNKTDANLLIEDYLIERIAQAKTGRQPKKVLYDTLYKHAQITTRKQKDRAPGKIQKCLDHYKACGMIAGYKMLKDSIQLEF